MMNVIRTIDDQILDDLYDQALAETQSMSDSELDAALSNAGFDPAKLDNRLGELMDPSAPPAAPAAKPASSGALWQVALVGAVAVGLVATLLYVRLTAPPPPPPSPLPADVFTVPAPQDTSPVPPPPARPAPQTPSPRTDDTDGGLVAPVMREKSAREMCDQIRRGLRRMTQWACRNSTVSGGRVQLSTECNDMIRTIAKTPQDVEHIREIQERAVLSQPAEESDLRRQAADLTRSGYVCRVDDLK